MVWFNTVFTVIFIIMFVSLGIATLVESRRTDPTRKKGQDVLGLIFILTAVGMMLSGAGQVYKLREGSP